MTGPAARRRSGPRSGSPRGLAGAPPRGSPRGPRRAPTVPSRRLGRALTAARAGRRAQLTELVEWLAIPSVSGDSRHAADVVRAADLLAGSLRRAGATVATLGTPAGAPVVVGWVPGRRGWPTVLVYGHYDVVSAGSGWTSPPFRPALRDGALVARGSADDKGQLSACLAALHAWSAVGGPPCTVVVAADGAEEIGSPGLRPALARLARHVRPDLVLVCDTERAPDGAPSVTLSQRGHAVVELVVQTGGSPVHAGRFGGAVVDPAQELARAVHAVRAALPTGRQVSGPVVSNRPDADIIRATGGRAVLGAGLDEKVTLGPALTVVRTDAGSGPGLVPVRAAARLDLRLPPAADVGCAVAAARRAARAATSPDVRLNLTVLRGASGLSAEPEEGDLVLLDHVARFAFGRGVQLVRSGGSLPAASMLAEEFGRRPVLLGLGTPGGGAHGPDERMDLLGWTRASALLVAVFGSSCASSGGFRQYPTPSAQHCDSYRS